MMLNTAHNMDMVEMTWPKVPVVDEMSVCNMLRLITGPIYLYFCAIESH